MSLSIDSSRPLRTHRELTALVDAIVQAPVAEPETHSVEWKSTFDLRNNADHRFEVGKHILGFGNRHPDRAAGEFNGSAYLVLGAEPQAVPGVPVEDPADLDNWIAPYAGADGPQWSVDYVQSNDQDILVVTIEAPVWGDDIQTLGKGFGTFLAGQIFVRRGGKTVQPDPSEVRMLQERAKRSSSRIDLEIGLCDAEAILTTYTATNQNCANWINSEGVRLYGPLQVRRARSSTPFEALTPVFAEDYRGIDGYEAEVQEYLGRAGQRWQSLLLEGAVRRQLARLRLCIDNSTDENFAAVQLVVRLPDNCFVFFDNDGPERLLEPPDPPKPWGQGPIAALDVKPFFPSFDQEGEILREDKRYKVIFSPTHVRPRRREQLPTLYLALPRNLTSDEVTVSWEATSTSAAGAIDGAITLPVAKDPVEADELVGVATSSTQD